MAADNIAIPTNEELPGVFHDSGTPLNFAHCMIQKYMRGGGQIAGGRCNGEIRSTFPTFVNKVYNQSKNLLIVAEDLDRVAIDYVRVLYWLRPYRRIRVVVTYRRMHQWLRSYYDQIVDMYTPKYIQ